MKKQITEQVRERVDDAVIIKEVLVQNVVEVAEPLAELFDPDYARDRKSGHLKVAEKIEALSAELEGQEQALNAELQDDEAQRDVRKIDANELAEAIRQVRSSFISVFGDASPATYGMSGRTPRDPAEMATWTANAIGLMHEKPASGTNLLGTRITTAQTIALLEPLYRTLRDALAAVEDEKTELTSAYTRRNQAMDDFDRIADYARETACADYNVCGREDLADRLRSRLRGPQPAEVLADAPVDTKKTKIVKKVKEAKDEI